MRYQQRQHRARKKQKKTKDAGDPARSVAMAGGKRLKTFERNKAAHYSRRVVVLGSMRARGISRDAFLYFYFAPRLFFIFFPPCPIYYHHSFRTHSGRRPARRELLRRCTRKTRETIIIACRICLAHRNNNTQQ